MHLLLSWNKRAFIRNSVGMQQMHKFAYALWPYAVQFNCRGDNYYYYHCRSRARAFLKNSIWYNSNRVRCAFLITINGLLVINMRASSSSPSSAAIIRPILAAIVSNHHRHGFHHHHQHTGRTLINCMLRDNHRFCSLIFKAVAAAAVQLLFSIFPAQTHHTYT